MAVSLSVVVQGKEETLEEYVEHFTREVVEVKGGVEKSLTV
ncbi:hypothetical protein A2U01_0118785, partial [Trifolium medium]|nr:hypothetical protein [Trifolium medium]